MPRTVSGIQNSHEHEGALSLPSPGREGSREGPTESFKANLVRGHAAAYRPLTCSFPLVTRLTARIPKGRGKNKITLLRLERMRLLDSEDGCAPPCANQYPRMGGRRKSACLSSRGEIWSRRTSRGAPGLLKQADAWPLPVHCPV